MQIPFLTTLVFCTTRLSSKRIVSLGVVVCILAGLKELLNVDIRVQIRPISKESTPPKLPLELIAYVPGPHRVHVHVGKAGGTSMQALIHKFNRKCRNPRIWAQHFSNRSTLTPQQVQQAQICAITSMKWAHCNFAKPFLVDKNYSNFLVNVRNPLDRLNSWFEYERKLIKPGELPKWRNSGEASQNAIRLHEHCYSSLEHLVNQVLLQHDSNAADTTATAATTTTTPPTKTGTNTTDSDHCRELALTCLRGEILCFAHNFYNYEYYLEELLLWKGAAIPDDGAPGVDNLKNEQGTYQRDIRVDVIRTEHPLEDLNRTMKLWTGWPVSQPIQSAYGQANRNKLKRDAPESTDVNRALCRYICTELVAYKMIISVADNLAAAEVEETHKRLDDVCGFRVDEVCGTEFRYRNVKAQKMRDDHPW